MKFVTNLFVVFIIFFSINVSAQTFEITLHDTELNCPIGELTSFHIDVTNTSDNELELYVVRRLFNFPDGWITNLCFKTCYPPHLDSIVTNSEFGNTPLAVGETRTIYVDVTASSEETTTIRIIVADVRHPLQTKLVTLTANGVVTGIEDEMNTPLEFSLAQNYPNPFSKKAGGNPTTTIKFSIPENSNTVLTVFNLLGEKVADLVNNFLAAGTYSVEFKADDLPSGIYLYRLQSGNFTDTKRMLLIK